MTTELFLIALLNAIVRAVVPNLPKEIGTVATDIVDAVETILGIPATPTTNPASPPTVTTG